MVTVGWAVGKQAHWADVTAYELAAMPLNSVLCDLGAVLQSRSGWNSSCALRTAASPVVPSVQVNPTVGSPYQWVPVPEQSFCKLNNSDWVSWCVQQGVGAGVGKPDDGALEGVVDGCVEGKFEGEFEGEFEGDVEGKAEGEVDGKAEGEVDGNADGVADGNADGVAEGKADGALEGDADGCVEGDADGCVEGVVEGVADGAAVF